MKDKLLSDKDCTRVFSTGCSPRGLFTCNQSLLESQQKMDYIQMPAIFFFFTEVRLRIVLIVFQITN